MPAISELPKLIKSTLQPSQSAYRRDLIAGCQPLVCDLLPDEYLANADKLSKKAKKYNIMGERNVNIPGNHTGTFGIQNLRENAGTDFKSLKRGLRRVKATLQNIGKTKKIALSESPEN
jgi:hypothetical protein